MVNNPVINYTYYKDTELTPAPPPAPAPLPAPQLALGTLGDFNYTTDIVPTILSSLNSNEKKIILYSNKSLPLNKSSSKYSIIFKDKDNQEINEIVLNCPASSDQGWTFYLENIKGQTIYLYKNKTKSPTIEHIKDVSENSSTTDNGNYKASLDSLKETFATYYNGIAKDNINIVDKLGNAVKTITGCEVNK